jgi:hypothetical protein
MKSRLALALAVAICLTAPVASVSAATPLFRYSIDSSPDFSNLARTAERNGYVVLQAWRLDELRAIKAANPTTKVLVYKNLSFASAGSDPSRLASTGVTYAEADENGWFLKNSSGQRFSSNGYNWLWAMDIGNPDYQRRWADNVVSEVTRNGWDGVLLDDVNPTMKYHYDVTSVAKYPSDASYSAATRSALAVIGPRIQAAGKLAIANNACWVEYFSTGVDWLRFLDGAMDEMFLKWGAATGQGYRGESQWTTQLNELKETQRQGKIFIGKTQSANGDALAARYGYATVLLGTQGRAGYSFGDHTVETPMFPEYRLAIGDPLGPEERLSNGVHRRAFSTGQVLVNPTSGTQSASLGGSYSGSGLTSVSSVAMPSHTGLVLTRDGTGTDTGTVTPPAPAPAPISRPRKPKPPRTMLVVSQGARGGSVSLTWTRAAGARRYRILRDGKHLGVTKRRAFVDRQVQLGKHYHYRVVALGRGGRRSLPSRAVRVRVRSGHIDAAVRTNRPAAWSRAKVLRLVRSRTGHVWRPATQLRRRARGASVRVRARSSSVFRVVAHGDGTRLSARVSVRRAA